MLVLLAGPGRAGLPSHVIPKNIMNVLWPG